MKWMLWLLLSSFCCAQAGVISSRRYTEKNPTQFVFGSFQTIYPYNQPNGYAAIPENQFIPVSVDTNNCASSANFTSSGSGTQSLTTSGNICTISSTSGSASHYWYYDTGTVYSFAFPAVVWKCVVTQNGASTASGSEFDCGTFKDANDNLYVGFNQNSQKQGIFLIIGGTVHAICSVNLLPVPMIAPYTVALALVGNDASAWIDNGWGLQPICNGNVSSFYNFQTSGLSGWFSAFQVQIPSSDTWKVSLLEGGIYGGTGIADESLFEHQDGTPYLNGPVATFVASVRGLQSGTDFTDNSTLTFTLNLNNGIFTPVGSLGDSRTGFFNDIAMGILYQLSSGNEWMLAGTYANNSDPVSVQTVCSKQAIGTDDWASAGMHLAPSATQLTLAGGSNWDAHTSCVSNNYSAGTCGLWRMADSAAAPNVYFTQFSSTSDPCSNAWTQTFQDTANAVQQGERVIRTATTYLGQGVNYTYCSQSGSTTTRCYNQAGTYLGALNASSYAAQAGGHPQLLAYGNTEFFVTSNSNVFSTTTLSGGDLVVATAPKYASSLSWVPMPSISPSTPQFVGSATVSITDSAGGATICYTTDGSTPTANGAGVCTHGTIYSGSFVVTTNTTVEAIGSEAGSYDSWVQRTDFTSQPTPLMVLYSVNAATAPLSTTQYAYANIPYLTVCSNSGSSSNTISYSPAAAASNSVKSGNWIMGWATFSSAGNTTFTCNLGSTSFTSMKVMVCPLCNGTVESFFSGSASSTTSMTISSISATNRNYSVYCALAPGTPNSSTIDSITASYQYAYGSDFSTCYVAKTTAGYSGASAIMSSASSGNWNGAVIALDY